MRRAASATLALLLLAAAPARAETASAVFAAYDALMRADDPDRSTGWPEVTPAAIAARRHALVALRDRLRVAGAASTGEDALSRDILLRKIDLDIEGYAFDEERIPFRSGEGFFDTPGFASANVVVRNRAEAEAWLARIAAIPAWFDANVANMRRGIATRFVQPKLIVENVLVSLRTTTAQPVDSDPLLKPFARLPAAMPAAEQDALRARARALVETRIKPAQRALLAFMEGTYLPAARTTIGARSLPGGEAYYRFAIRRSTTTDMTPEQIYALGVQEVARIRGEMDALVRKSGFKGSLADYIAMLRADPANYATSVEQYVEKVSEAGKRADRALPLLFGKLPRLTWGPKVKPPEQENSSAGYLPGNAAAGVPGSVVLSRANAMQSPLYSMSAWVFHEGVPGHHLQIALAQERTDLPEFRRQDGVTAFVEGWALYTERLSEEAGLYRDDKERFGKLSWEIWRACRLEMDTGIHWMGWTRPQAMACLEQNSALAPSEITRETDRYISWPGQALAYKIGEIRIRAMRARAEKALGDKFDIRRFHDAVLDDGGMPLDILDRKIDAWIAAGGK